MSESSVVSFEHSICFSRQYWNQTSKSVDMTVLVDRFRLAFTLDHQCICVVLIITTSADLQSLLYSHRQIFDQSSSNLSVHPLSQSPSSCIVSLASPSVPQFLKIYTLPPFSLEGNLNQFPENITKYTWVSYSSKLFRYWAIYCTFRIIHAHSWTLESKRDIGIGIPFGCS